MKERLWRTRYSLPNQQLAEGNSQMPLKIGSSPPDTSAYSGPNPYPNVNLAFRRSEIRIPIAFVVHLTASIWGESAQHIPKERLVRHDIRSPVSEFDPKGLGRPPSPFFCRHSGGIITRELLSSTLKLQNAPIYPYSSGGIRGHNHVGITEFYLNNDFSASRPSLSLTDSYAKSCRKVHSTRGIIGA